MRTYWRVLTYPLPYLRFYGFLASGNKIGTEYVSSFKTNKPTAFDGRRDYMRSLVPEAGIWVWISNQITQYTVGCNYFFMF